MSKWAPKTEVLAELHIFPFGLDLLYELMMDRICASKNADLCRQILALMSTVFRPVATDELACFVDSLRNMSDEQLAYIIRLYGSFLKIQEHTVYFVH
jgi:hypothetical protein